MPDCCPSPASVLGLFTRVTWRWTHGPWGLRSCPQMRTVRSQEHVFLLCSHMSPGLSHSCCPHVAPAHTFCGSPCALQAPHLCAPSGLCWGENKDSVNTHFVFTKISFHIRLAPELVVCANPLLTLTPASPLSPGQVRTMSPHRGTVKQYFSTSEQVTLTLQSLCSEKAVIKAWPVQCFSKTSAEHSIKNKIP